MPQALRRRVREVALLLENGSTPAPKQLEGWLREQERALEGQRHFHVYWLPTNASWLDQVEIWLSILQRKLLPPHHFVSTADVEQAISQFLTYYNQAAKPLKWTYTVEQLEHTLATLL